MRRGCIEFHGEKIVGQDLRGLQICTSYWRYDIRFPSQMHCPNLGGLNDYMKFSHCTSSRIRREVSKSRSFARGLGPTTDCHDGQQSQASHNCQAVAHHRL